MVLTRDEFRRQVFEHDGHHIIGRRLWTDGGYCVENAATLCDDGRHDCHYKAEISELSVEDIRIAAGIENGIEKAVLPEDRHHDHVYDKWGA